MSLMSNLSAAKQKIFDVTKKVTMGTDEHYDMFKKMNVNIDNFKHRPESFVANAKENKGLVNVALLDPKHKEATMKRANKNFDKYHAKKLANDESYAAKFEKDPKNKELLKASKEKSKIFSYNESGEIDSIGLHSVHQGYKDQMSEYRITRNIAAMQSGNGIQRAAKKGAVLGVAGGVGYSGVKAVSGYSGDDYYDY